MLLTEKNTATIEDYEQLPEGAPYELIDGELVMTPSASVFHEQITDNIMLTLGIYIRSHQLGKLFTAPLDVYFSEHNVFQPDLFFVHQDKVHLIGKGKVNVIPDMVIEILSPSNAYVDLTHKKAIYCEYGVSEYWVVDPEDETMEIMVKDGEYYRTEALIRKGGVLSSPMFTGFSVKMDEVFAF